MGGLPDLRSVGYFQSMDGRLIVIEGVDGAGTTTQASVLADALRAQQRPAHLTQQPSPGPVGAMLRQALTGRLVCNGDNGPRPPEWQMMALLFAADRLDHQESEIAPNLRDGVTVICDRYDHSSVAYQSVTSGRGDAVVPWIRELNRWARRPDLTFVLDVPFEVAESRREQRGKPELFEEGSLQRKLVGFYSQLERHFPDDAIVHVPASSSVNEVADIIWRETNRLFQT